MTVEPWSVIRTTFAKFGPTSIDPAGQRAALADHDVALGDPVVAALADRDEPPELRRFAGDHLGGDRLVLERVLELEEPRQKVVLALDLHRPRVLLGQPFVLGPERGVVGVELLDLGDRS